MWTMIDVSIIMRDVSWEEYILKILNMWNSIYLQYDIGKIDIIILYSICNSRYVIYPTQTRIQFIPNICHDIYTMKYIRYKAQDKVSSLDNQLVIWMYILWLLLYHFIFYMFTLYLESNTLNTRLSIHSHTIKHC